MKTSKHTPGPWRVEPPYMVNLKGVMVATNRFPISHKIDANARGILAEVTGIGGTDEVSQSNARLVANAPAMFAALKAIESLLDGSQPKDIPGALMVVRFTLAGIEVVEEVI